VFSKHAEGRFPEDAEVVEALRDRKRPKGARSEA
jgi:hypothetical protein